MQPSARLARTSSTQPLGADLRSRGRCSRCCLCHFSRYHPTALGLPEGCHSSFQAGLRRALDVTARAYTQGVDEQHHVQRIAELADRMSADYSGVLREGRFRIGAAQKALNLFLKYLWCTGSIPTPPHCPFDALVIQMLPGPDRLNWTTLDDLGGYRNLVAAARRLAGTTSLAEWEPREYDKVSTATQVRYLRSAARVDGGDHGIPDSPAWRNPKQNQHPSRAVPRLSLQDPTCFIESIEQVGEATNLGDLDLMEEGERARGRPSSALQPT